MKPVVGLIVGSGLQQLAVEIRWGQIASTPFGAPSSPLGELTIGDCPVLVLARHGLEQSLAPHEVNYRANLWVLHRCRLKYIVGANVVGAIAHGFGPGDIAIPDQIIDYTHGRDSSFGDLGGGIPHIDFTEPFDPELSGRLAAAAGELGYSPRRGVYGVTQGPRLETAAEIDRLERDGCAMVGMTAMPEASLARELSLRYAVVAAAVNYAAGRSPTGTPIHAELIATATQGMERIAAVIARALRDLSPTL